MEEKKIRWKWQKCQTNDLLKTLHSNSITWISFRTICTYINAGPYTKWFSNDISCRQMAIHLCDFSKIKRERKERGEKKTFWRIQINSNLRNFWHNFFGALMFVHFSPFTEVAKRKRHIGKILQFLRVICACVVACLLLHLFSSMF